ncbi:unnamed protein product [Diatraea saccharalis]|uniref:Periaxin n=1 Tax=Diatraea saccharalis TaxID=40085 RepID=A0A9N9QX42_9NEOP|nr:unnamed protein product [Diatraea saccharalis]
MILPGALLFFLGTLVSASPFLPSLPTEIVVNKHKHELPDKVKILSSSSGSALIENYIQQGTNIFFKPQFLLSSDKLPPQLQPIIAAIEKDDCKKAYPLVTPVVIDEPLRVVEKEISEFGTEIEHITEVKPAPYVDVPKPVAPVIMEDIKPLIISELPKPPHPELALIVKEPLMHHFVTDIKEEIPPAPILPPIELPKLPVLFEEAPPKPVLVEIEEEQEIKVPVVIPPGPVLPPMEMPKLPVLFEEAQPKPDLVEIEEEKEIKVPVVIPPGPVLPPMEMPKLPVLVEEIPLPHEDHPVSPIIVKEEEPEHIEELVVVPPAPILPPIELPKLPVVLEETPLIHELPSPVIVEKVEEHIQNIPPAPVLLPLEVPKVSVVMEEHNIESTKVEVPCEPEKPKVVIHEMQHPIYIEQNRFLLPAMPHTETSKFTVEIPRVPSLISSIPDFNKNKHCVDDIVVERILPKMRKDIIYERSGPYLTPFL